MSTWTDELKTEVISRYVETMTNDYADDASRAENSTQVVQTIVDELKESDKLPGATVNGVRMILVKAEVYHKKAPGAKSAGGGAAKEGGTKRVSKAEAHMELTNLINSIDPALVDEEIIGKFTGKAAQYVSSVLVKVL